MPPLGFSTGMNAGPQYQGQATGADQMNNAALIGGLGQAQGADDNNFYGVGDGLEGLPPLAGKFKTLTNTELDASGKAPEKPSDAVQGAPHLAAEGVSGQAYGGPPGQPGAQQHLDNASAAMYSQQ